METVAERLRWAREKAGYASATDAARAFGWRPSTYLGHENGSRGLRREAAERYARAFGVNWSWLLTGETMRVSIPPVAPDASGADAGQLSLTLSVGWVLDSALSQALREYVGKTTSDTTILEELRSLDRRTRIILAETLGLISANESRFAQQYFRYQDRVAHIGNDEAELPSDAQELLSAALEGFVPREDLEANLTTLVNMGAVVAASIALLLSTGSRGLVAEVLRKVADQLVAVRDDSNVAVGVGNAANDGSGEGVRKGAPSGRRR